MADYAKDALELAKQQELTTQLESQKNIKASSVFVDECTVCSYENRLLGMGSNRREDKV